MQTAEYDYKDFSPTSDADKALATRFFYKTVPDQAASVQEGRPMFREKEYIEIRIPGQRDPQACRPATHADKQRFPAHYDAFKRRVEAPVEGMPLAEWPQISRTQVEELTFLNVKTVEQLAAMKDSNISAFMGGYSLREKAQKWLEMNSQASEQRDKQEMRDEIAELKVLVAKLTVSAPAELDGPGDTIAVDTVTSGADEPELELNSPELDTVEETVAPKPRRKRK